MQSPSTKEADAASCLLLCTWIHMEGSPCFHVSWSTLTPVWLSRGQGPECSSTTGPDSLRVLKPHGHLDSSHTSSVVPFVSGQPGFPDGATSHRHCPGKRATTSDHTVESLLSATCSPQSADPHSEPSFGKPTWILGSVILRNFLKTIFSLHVYVGNLENSE